MIVLEIIVSLHDDWRHRFNGIRCIFMTSVLVAKNGSIVQWHFDWVSEVLIRTSRLDHGLSHGRRISAERQLVM